MTMPAPSAGATYHHHHHHHRGEESNVSGSVPHTGGRGCRVPTGDTAGVGGAGGQSPHWVSWGHCRVWAGLGGRVPTGDTVGVGGAGGAESPLGLLGTLQVWAGLGGRVPTGDTIGVGGAGGQSLHWGHCRCGRGWGQSPHVTGSPGNLQVWAGSSRSKVAETCSPMGVEPVGFRPHPLQLRDCRPHPPTRV